MWILLAAAALLVGAVTLMVTMSYHDDGQKQKSKTTGTQLPVSEKHVFTFLGDGAADDETLEDVVYSDSFFDGANDGYSHPLAQASLALALSGSKKEYAGSLLTDLGFGGIKAYRYQERLDEDKAAAVFGYKYISNGQGIAESKDQTLIAVCLRGGMYGEEWGSNGRVGYEGEAFGYHYGFHTAADDIVMQLQEYAVTQGLDLHSSKIWITGYSRGAAVAGCVGYKLQNGAEVSPDDIFCYTFASPRTVSSGTLESELSKGNTDKGIYNIVSKLDIVTHLPMDKRGSSKVLSSGKTVRYNWDYTRYGTTKEIPASEDKKAEQTAVELLEKALAFSTRNERAYVKKHQDETVIPLLKKNMASGKDVKRKNVIRTIIRALPGTTEFLVKEWNDLDFKTQLYLGNLLSGEAELKLAQEHWPEAYWKAMERVGW